MNKTAASLRSESRDSIAFWCDSALGGTELFRGRCVEHRFEPHFHETYVVAVFEAGVQRWSIGRKTGLATPGCVMLIPPGETHTGQAYIPEGWAYRACYPSEQTLVDLAESMREKPQRSFFSRTGGVVCAPASAQRLASLHDRLEQGGDSIERQSAFAQAMEEILGMFRMMPSDAGTAKIEHRAIRRAVEFLEDCFWQDVQLSDVADYVGLSSFRLMHLFKAGKGITLHSYLTQVRLRHARRQLLAGEAAADVAMAVGFADQAHFSRQFKRHFGVTPGHYRKTSRI